jgi:hypothetical protein
MEITCFLFQRDQVVHLGDPGRPGDQGLVEDASGQA